MARSKQRDDDWEIPRTIHGGHFVFEPPHHLGLDLSDLEWLPSSHEVDLVLQFVNFDKGHGAARDIRMVFHDVTTGREYKMFLDDAGKLLQTQTLTKGLIAGRWGFTKRSERIGIVYKDTCG